MVSGLLSPEICSRRVSGIAGVGQRPIACHVFEFLDATELEYHLVIAVVKSCLVPEEGLEPPHPCGYEILSLARLPFHHSGRP